MTEFTEKPRTDSGFGPTATGSRQPWLLAAIAMVAGVAILAVVALFGYSTAYCRELKAAIVWTILNAVEGPWYVWTQDPLAGLVGLIAGLALIAGICRYSRFRLSWARFSIAVAVAYAGAAIVTWLTVANAVCRFM